METKQEVTAPNIIVKNANRIESKGELFSRVASGEIKEITLKAPAGMNEDTANADGGYLVTHDIDSEIYGRMFEGGKIAPKCRKIQLGPNYNGRKLPYLNVTTQSTTSAPRLYSLAEGGQKTATKQIFGQHDIALVKLVALVPLTDELLQDRPTLEGYVMEQLRGNFAWMQDYNILYGTSATTGNLGILDVTASAFLAEPVAHAATPTVAIVNEVINGVSPQVRDGAEWYMSGDMWAYVMSAMGPGVASVLVPIAREEGGVRTLQGHPVNLIDGMTAHNTANDLLFMNPKQIVILEKGGITVSRSTEFYFDTDQTCLRFVLRQASAPVFATYTAADGKVYGAASATS